MQLSHVVLLLIVGLSSVLEICEAQDYPVFRRARVRSDEDIPSPSVRVGPRGRKVRVRVRARPLTQTTEESEERDSGAVEAFPQIQVVPVRQSLQARIHHDSDEAAQYIPREPVRVLVPQQPQTRTRVTSSFQQQSPLSTSQREKTPPVLTIRNYSNVNEDGSFTFGYEAADGSFKEETRGIDCVVRGKYGYVDPEGVRREFTYVSGNPCDPNAPQEDEEDEDEEEDPSRPPQRLRPINRPLPVFTPVEQKLEQILEERIPDEELPQHFRQRQQQLARPVPKSRPLPSFAAAVNSLRHPPTEEDTPATYRPRLRVRIPATTTPAPTLPAPTPRTPVTSASPVNQGSIYAFDYENGQDGVFRVPVRPVARPQFDFDSQIRQIQQFQPIPQPTPVPQARKVKRPTPRPQELRPTPQNKLQIEEDNNPKGPIYSSELIYDPSTGQYTTLLVQQLPKVNTEINLNQRIQGFVQPSSQPPQIILRAQPQPARQQLQHQQHQQQPLTNFIQQPHALQYQPAGVQPYYIAANNQRSQVASGQIDQFLRTYNVQY